MADSGVLEVFLIEGDHLMYNVKTSGWFAYEGVLYLEADEGSFHMYPLTQVRKWTYTKIPDQSH